MDVDQDTQDWAAGLIDDVMASVEEHQAELEQYRHQEQERVLQRQQQQQQQQEDEDEEQAGPADPIADEELDSPAPPRSPSLPADEEDDDDEPVRPRKSIWSISPSPEPSSAAAPPPPPPPPPKRKGPSGNRVVRCRPLAQGQYYSKSPGVESDAAFAALRPARQNLLSHVARIEEHGFGVVRADKCERCRTKGRICKEYTAHGKQMYTNGTFAACVRCYYDGKPYVQ